MLNDYATKTYMCSFCETLVGENQLCPKCNDYKGIMTIAEFSAIFEDEM